MGSQPTETVGGPITPPSRNPGADGPAGAIRSPIANTGLDDIRTWNSWISLLTRRLIRLGCQLETCGTDRRVCLGRLRKRLQLMAIASRWAPTAARRGQGEGGEWGDLHLEPGDVISGTCG